TMAIMAVPLIIATSAAVDMSRVIVARTVLQAAVDTAAASGAGAWGTSSSGTNGGVVAAQAFKAYAASVTNYAPLASGSPNISLICTGGSGSCGAGTYAITGPSRCNNPCVFVTASVKLNNLLVGFLAPSTTVSVSAAAGAVLQQQITGADIPPSPGFGSAGDHSDIYAYAVSDNAGGTAGSAGWSFGTTPPPNQNCGTTTGTISLIPEVNQPGSTACNYLFIADSKSAGTSGAGGSITLAKNQPIGFTFIDDTGANGYTQANSTASTTQLVVSVVNRNNNSTVLPKTYEPNGYQVNYYGYTSTVYSCSQGYLVNYDYYDYYGNYGNQNGPYNSCSGDYGGYYFSQNSTPVSSSSPPVASGCTAYADGNCTSYTDISNSSSGTVTASASCPAETLYGALSSGYGAPTYDNIDEYSSASEVLGYPPTYITNHALVPFVSTAVHSINYSIGGTNYTMKVQAICPNYPLSGTNISAPVSSSYASAFASYYTSGSATYGGTAISNISNFNLNIFSTAFPGVNFSGTGKDMSGLYNGTASTTPTEMDMTSATGNIYPPTVAGCTPTFGAEDNNATTSAVDPWWNWNQPNTGGNCANENSTNQGAYLTSGQAAYGDCALLIQPLGTAVPTVPIIKSGQTYNEAVMPDYYLIVSTQPPSATTTSTIVALDPVWDGQTFTDLLPGVITNNLGGYDPNITVSGSQVQDQDPGPIFSSTGAIISYGYVPTNSLSTANYYQLTSGKYSGDYVIIVIPAQNGNFIAPTSSYDFNPPSITSHQCYNSQKNGNASGTAVIATGGGGTPITDTATGDQNNGSPIDPVANPQLGAVICNSDPPETYAMYWNDLGTYGSDDLGYWNAVISFTCPVAGTTSPGGPVTIFQ
ncbi:Tad domain-containing protein, partial [Acidocella sp.]|uniref:Tad domain-containing protein n=1 Tax=Acidocella sp. TaxID=50710 RepID=UPI00262FBA6C